MVFEWQQATLSNSSITYGGGELRVFAKNSGVGQDYTSSGGLSDTWQAADYTFTATATSEQIIVGVKASSFRAAIVIDGGSGCSICFAGSDVPVLSSTTITNTCPASTIDLTSITASNTPSGITLTYHTGTPATNVNKISTPTAQAATGTYYAAFYDATVDCYSGPNNGDGSATTEITATTTNCCAAGNDAPLLIKN